MPHSTIATEDSQSGDLQLILLINSIGAQTSKHGPQDRSHRSIFLALCGLAAQERACNSTHARGYIGFIAACKGVLDLVDRSSAAAFVLVSMTVATAVMVR